MLDALGMPSIEVAATAGEALHLEACTFVVVDLLRATTTIATLFEAGLRDLLAVSDIEQAREYARRDGRLLFGEVGGLPPPGFDFGNSPVEAATASVRGERAVLFTTNGTTALCALAGRGKVIAGALANLGAVASAASELSNIAIVCAGEDGGRRFALEDFAAAGVIAGQVAARLPGASLGDGALLALRCATDVDSLARMSAHGRATAALGFERDITFALRTDTSRAVPTSVEWGPGWIRLVDGGVA
ncbi:MAG: 2-phosphosulfolactate phosphatase [Chloroflexi bacterium CFX7]|nr:2-phosphosulfolactate phosphatase [Chloroflexi bacterium CFX7]